MPEAQFECWTCLSAGGLQRLEITVSRITMSVSAEVQGRLCSPTMGCIEHYISASMKVWLRIGCARKGTDQLMVVLR